MSDNLQSMNILQTDNPHLLRRLEQEVHVWLTRPEDVMKPHKSYLSLLSLEERQRYRQFRFDRDRHHFLVAHALLRRVLSAYVDVDPSNWQFSSNQHGRPEISAPKIAPSLRFNLTHTAGLVACVVALELDCGIDAEQLSARGNLMGVGEKMFAASEQQVLQALDGQTLLERFYCYWTLREAYCKALGVGIAHAKRNYRFLTEDDGRWTIGFDAPSDGESHHWQFTLIKPTTEHVLAVAVRTGGAPAKPVIHGIIVP